MPAPKLKPGEKDGRVKNSAPKKPAEQKRDQIVKVGLTPAEKEWLVSKGGSKWLVEQIKRGMGEQ